MDFGDSGKAWAARAKGSGDPGKGQGETAKASASMPIGCGNPGKPCGEEATGWDEPAMDSGQTANLWAETEKLIDIQGNQSAMTPVQLAITNDQPVPVELRLRDHGKEGDQEPLWSLAARSPASEV